MKFFLFLSGVIINISLFGQDNKCECGGLLDINNLKKISILKKPDGPHKYFIQNNKPKEIFYSFDILQQKNNFFQVIPFAMEKALDTGWINGSYLKIYARNYSSKLILYSKPSSSSSSQVVIKKYNPDTYQILACRGKWVYVRLIKNRIYEGWLDPNMQCDNPYTTCN
ncbi:MAG: hypothetical protein JWO92_80 [Chitinophagaceae bacterium]|nr:hypothetical protein [Chitinophagaceae bacterium]